MPFAGLWEGTMILEDGPGTGRPFVMRIDVADVSRRSYAGFTLLPGNDRAPHDKTRVRDGLLQWEQPNSGGGLWHYSARLTSRDSLSVTVMLRGWPQGGGKTPNGTFVLVRQAERTGARRS